CCARSNPMMSVPSNVNVLSKDIPNYSAPVMNNIPNIPSVPMTIPKPVQSQPSVLKEDCGCSLD
ncbi:hypothetical protein EBU71_18730, partial [bacterium]|nr:hypothetical protein [Candidatus Elulimicrobium humile]